MFAAAGNLSIWWLNFAYGNQAGAQNNFSQFKYYSFDLPDILVPITELKRDPHLEMHTRGG